MSSQEALPPGLPRMINDRYEIDSLIGRGGMADVYLATDHVLARKVAVKVLRHDTASNPMVVSRFRREAKAVAALSHPNIVAVYDTGELPVSEHQREALPFMVMEYVTGQTLKQVIASGDIDADFAVHVTRGICDALDHSHQNNVVHRDIKPANVMVTDSGYVKLMDFGIARAIDTSATMTQTAAVVGTAQYFSPEQARGEQVDFRSDIYSAGCFFYELLTRKPPFTGDSPVSVAYQHVGEVHSNPSEVHPEVDPIFDPIVSKVLSKDREARFQSAGAFADALENALRGVEFQEDEPSPSTYTLPIYGMHDPATTSVQASAPVDSAQHPVFNRDQTPAAPVQHKSNRGLIVFLTIIALLAVGIASFLVFRSLQAEAAKRAPVAVPEVLELTEDDAKNLLNAEGFSNIRVDHEFSDQVAEELSTRTDPGAGVKISKESTITLYISDGSEQRTIPESINNQSESAARDALREAGLEVGDVSRENSPTVPTDWVIGTTPEAGTKVKAGTKVDLILSTGKVDVPDVVGKTAEQALELFKELGLEKVALDTSNTAEETEDYAPRTIIRQTPEASGTMDQGDTISVTLAKAPEAPEPEPSSTPDPEQTPDQEEDSAEPDESQDSESDADAASNRRGKPDWTPPGRTDQ